MLLGGSMCLALYLTLGVPQALGGAGFGHRNPPSLAVGLGLRDSRR